MTNPRFMFETAELEVKVDKETYKKEAEKLRVALLAVQKQLAASKLSAVVVIGGVEGGGKTELANQLLEWMDARGVEVHSLGEPTDEERERPRFWRFWRELPPAGKIGVFVGTWYTQPIVSRVFKEISSGEFESEMVRIEAFERMLAQENTVVVKLWLHLSKARQKKVLKALEKDPETAWRVTRQDWKFCRKYGKFRRVSEEAILKTDTEFAPWRIIDAADRRARTLACARALLDAVSERLKAPAPPHAAKPPLPKPKKVNILSKLDMGLALGRKAYEEQLRDYQVRLNLLTRRLRAEGRSLMLVFEGPDAAGKGGAIRRLTQAMDARNYRVQSVAAPTDEERAHPYLWRFWRALPRLGRVTIFDRSWYGRVMVERLEGFCRPEDWKRAYEEINAFEAELAGFGTVIVKYWIAISASEQLARFKDREVTPYKQYKLTEEDWRNRAKWDGYQAAACDMIEKTATAHAPWVVVEGNDKSWARVKVVKAAVEALE